MAFSFHKEVTTPEALASSIDTDQHVLRWFTLLVVQPALRAREIQNPKTKILYKLLKKIVISQYLLYLLVATTFFILLIFQHYSYLNLGFLFIIPALYLHQRLKQCVKEIGMEVVSKDFGPSVLRQKTLYQISEHYSRAYGIPSIVDNIFTWDNTTRIIVIAGAILAGEMVPLLIKVYRVNFVLTFLIIITGCYFLFTLFNTFIIYKYLQTQPPGQTA